MSTATKGRAAEHEVRDYMREKGFYVVRSAASKSAFDLVCLPGPDSRHPTIDGQRWVLSYECPRWIGVSVKSGTARDSKGERTAKRLVAKHHGGVALFVRRRAGRLEPGQGRWILEWE